MKTIIRAKKAPILEPRDEFILKYFMNKDSIKPGDYTEDLLYFFQHYNDAMRNGEIFEQAFMSLYMITYNKNLTGADGYQQIGDKYITYEAKKEMKSKDLKLDGKSAWSIHCVETQMLKQNDPNFYLLQFGFKHGQLVYALKIKMDQTTIIKGKIPHKHSKMLASWKDFQNAKDIQPLFLNRNLIKQWAGSEFKNWLLSLTETDPSETGVDLRAIVGMKKDEPELYYHKDRYFDHVNSTPKFPSNGTTCLAVPQTLWQTEISYMVEAQNGEERSLQLDGGVLYLKKIYDRVGIWSTIDRLKSYRFIEKENLCL